MLVVKTSTEARYPDLSRASATRYASTSGASPGSAANSTRTTGCGTGPGQPPLGVSRHARQTRQPPSIHSATSPSASSNPAGPVVVGREPELRSQHLDARRAVTVGPEHPLQRPAEDGQPLRSVHQHDSLDPPGILPPGAPNLLHTRCPLGDGDQHQVDHVPVRV